MSWWGGEDASLVRSAKGDGHRQREVIPSKVVCFSIGEVDALSGEGDSRNPYIEIVEVRCMDSEGRDSTDDEGCELHGGQDKDTTCGWSSTPEYL